MPPRLPNPAWVDTVLTKAWPELSASSVAVPVVTGGKRKKADELGCGHYGCVLATNRPDVVLKVTSDPSEAAFVTLLQRHKLEEDGLVKYFDVQKVPGKRHNRDLFAIWREAAYDVGKVFPTSPPGRAATTSQLYDFRSLTNVKLGLIAFKDWAHTFRSVIKASANPWPLIDHAFKALQNGSHQHAMVELGGRNNDSVVLTHWPIRDTKTRLVVLLKACEMQAQMMGNEPAGYLVGQALERLLDAGILLADVHTGNIGRVDRPEHQGAVVITDPGHAVFLRKELSDEAVAISGFGAGAGSKPKKPPPDVTRALPDEVAMLRFVAQAEASSDSRWKNRSAFQPAGHRLLAAAQKLHWIEAHQVGAPHHYTLTPLGRTAMENGERMVNPAEVISLQGVKNQRAHEARLALGKLSNRGLTALFRLGYPAARSNVPGQLKKFHSQLMRLQKVVRAMFEKLIALRARKGNPAEVISLAERRAARAAEERHRQIFDQAQPILQALGRVVHRAGFDVRNEAVTDLVGETAVTIVIGREKGLW